MSARRRLLWLSVIANAALATAGCDPMVDPTARDATDEGVMEPASAPVQVTPPPRRARSLLQLERLEAVRAQPPAAELFAAKSWYIPPPPPPPPPPPAPPPPPPPPAPPPLPFVFMGRMIDAERLTVFLVKEDRVLMASEGDVIDDTYRLEKIEPRRLTFHYLPLDTMQALAVRDTP